MDEIRTNCILKVVDLECASYFLALTNDQLKFFNWLNDRGLVDNLVLEILTNKSIFKEV